MSEQRLREIAEREAAATPGPWMTDPWCEDDCEYNGVVNENDVKVMHGSESSHMDDEPIILARPEDMDFLCEARADIHWLLNNTRNAIDYCDRILAHNPNGAELMFLTEVKRILTGESDGRPTTEGTDGR